MAPPKPKFTRTVRRARLRDGVACVAGVRSNELTGGRPRPCAPACGHSAPRSAPQQRLVLPWRPPGSCLSVDRPAIVPRCQGLPADTLRGSCPEPAAPLLGGARSGLPWGGPCHGAATRCQIRLAELPYPARWTGIAEGHLVARPPSLRGTRFKRRRLIRDRPLHGTAAGATVASLPPDPPRG